MATKYSAKYLKNGEWENFALFSDKVPLDCISELCDSVFVNVLIDTEKVEVIDLDNGIVVYSVEDADDNYDYEDDVDETGFNPYEGCYDYDC